MTRESPSLQGGEDVNEGLVLSWMMVAWTVLFVLSAEALAWRARR